VTSDSAWLDPLGRAPIAVALDAPDDLSLHRWASAVAPFVSVLKVGLEVYLREGSTAVSSARAAADAAGAPCAIFLDLKLHDIPATVGKAALSIAPLNPDFVTVHASGGPAMIEAAVQALPHTRVTAVTVLTSLGAADLVALGLLDEGEDPRSLVVRWARAAVAAGAQAIVCSPHEVADVRAVVSDDIVLITPGVRPVGSASNDQQRVATPEQALADGADLLVIGRPITAAQDPGVAAAGIADSIRNPSTPRP
jgi:orotidine-5'-phosphate decarboxylase